MGWVGLVVAVVITSLVYTYVQNSISGLPLLLCWPWQRLRSAQFMKKKFVPTGR